MLYSVRFVKFNDGERYPILLDANGIPHWYVTLFITTQVRNASKSPNTIAAILSALRVLIDWANNNSIELEHRFAKRLFLKEQEMESLRNYSQTKKKDFENTSCKVIKLRKKSESIRALPRDNIKKVSSSTQYIRMSYIADYLEWLAIRVIETNAKHVDSDTLKRIKMMRTSFCARRPHKMSRSRENARKGLTEAQQALLFEVVKPGSNKNPFEPDMQNRNQIIVFLLFHLGLRVGELLALKISDFDFTSNTVLVARRHDNPDDPRSYQPVVKTADRRVPLSDMLVKAVSDYIMRDRRSIKSSRKHEYLLVTHRIGPYEGKPLSIKGLNKIFAEIKNALPNDIDGFSPHILRHTANDRFSQLMDKNKVEPAKEEKMRSYLMGWKEGSGSAAVYTRRHIETKARDAALKLQEYTQDMLKVHHE